MSLTAKPDALLASIPQPCEHDFELLRKADASLEKQVASLSVTRLALIIVLTFLFASGLHRRNEDAIQSILSKIRVSPTSPSQDRHDELSLDPIFTYLIPQSDSQEELYDSLRAQYSQLFTVKFSVLGTDLSFDLRLIIVTLPVWLSLALIYQSILREKRRLVRLIGHNLLTRAGPEQIAAMDKLTFGSEEGPYRSYPGILFDVSFWIVLLVLLGMMIWITDVRTSEEEPALIRFGLTIVFVCIFYALAWASRVASRLRGEVEERLGCVVPFDLFGRFWRSINQFLVSAPARVKPRFTLVASAILLFSTLVLQTAQVGCDRAENERQRAAEKKSQSSSPETQTTTSTVEAKPESRTPEKRVGYKLLLGAADWPPSLNPIMYFPNVPENLFGRTLYATALLLALIGLGVVGSLTFGARPPRILMLVLSYASMAVSLALVCEFAKPALLFLADLDSDHPSRVWLWGPGLAIVLVGFAKFSNPRRADVIYRILRMAYVPLVVADLFYLGAICLILPGLAILFFSAHLLTIGYFSVLSRTD